MAKIIIEILSTHKTKRQLLTFNHDSILIGRGYNNDIILEDGFVSENHLLIRLLKNGQICIEDIDSHNGTYIVAEKKATQKKTQLIAPTEIPSGTIINLGNTNFRIYHADHPVAQTKIIKELKASPFLITHTTTWYTFICFLILYFFDISSNNHKIENGFKEVIFYEIIILTAIIIWSSIWAFIGHLNVRKTYFRIQLTSTLLYYISYILIINFCGYVGFVFLNPYFEMIPWMLLFSISTAALLYNHITYATRITLKKRIIASTAIPILLCALIALSHMFFNNYFNLDVPYYARLKPPLTKHLKAKNIDDFINSLDAEFKKAIKKKDTNL